LILTSESSQLELTVDLVERALLDLGIAKHTFSLKKALAPSEEKLDAEKVKTPSSCVLIICNTNFAAKRLQARLVMPNVTINWYDDERPVDQQKAFEAKKSLNLDSEKEWPQSSSIIARPVRQSAVVARRMILQSLGIKDPTKQSNPPK
jgi:hypothetical protein